MPNWAPGQVLASADVNNWMVPKAAWKTAATSRASDTTKAADPDLQLALGAGTYVFECSIFFRASSSGQLAWAFSGPSGIAGTYAVLFYNTSGTQKIERAGITDPMGAAGGTYSNPLMIYGLARLSAAGTLAFTWAQVSSNSTATIVGQGSCLMAWRAA